LPALSGVPDSLGRRIDAPFIRAAARDLRRISRMRPSLSADGTIERVTQRMRNALILCARKQHQHNRYDLEAIFIMVRRGASGQIVHPIYARGERKDVIGSTA
jgi:hypothetical protein